jgi:hypothetical protein
MVRILSVVHLSMLCSPCDERRAVPACNMRMAAAGVRRTSSRPAGICALQIATGLELASQHAIQQQQCSILASHSTTTFKFRISLVPLQSCMQNEQRWHSKGASSRNAAASEGGGMVGVPLAVRGSGAGSAASSRLSTSRMKASTCGGGGSFSSFGAATLT